MVYLDGNDPASQLPLATLCLPHQPWLLLVVLVPLNGGFVVRQADIASPLNTMARNKLGGIRPASCEIGDLEGKVAVVGCMSLYL